MKDKIIPIITFVLLVVIGSLWVLSMKSNSQTDKSKTDPNSNAYPEAFINTYMSMCKIGKENCQCILDYLQKKYTYAEFTASGKGNNPYINEAVNYCKGTVKQPETSSPSAEVKK